jgi:hypothetical protein
MRSELVNNDSIYLSILEMFLELLNQFWLQIVSSKKFRKPMLLVGVLLVGVLRMRATTGNRSREEYQSTKMGAGIPRDGMASERRA